MATAFTQAALDKAKEIYKKASNAVYDLEQEARNATMAIDRKKAEIADLERQRLAVHVKIKEAEDAEKAALDDVYKMQALAKQQKQDNKPPAAYKTTA